MAEELNKKFIIYRSSAGSGKTFTLVKEYLKLALSDTAVPPLYYRSVLAITFTNKASAEMKERILKSLREISSGNTSPGTQTLATILGEDLKISTDILKQRANALLQDILHNYADFSISTIDSFVHRIIRTFAYDLKLPVNFGIETDEKNILQQCIDQLIAEIGHVEEITSVLLEYARKRIEENKNWQIDKDLKEFAGNVMQENQRRHLNLLKNLHAADFEKIRKEIAAWIQEFESGLKVLAEEAISIIQQHNLKEENFYQGKKGIYNYYLKIINKDFVTENLRNTYVLNTVEQNKWKAGKNSPEINAAIDAVSGSLLKIFNAIEERRQKGVEQYYLYKAVFKNIYALSVVNEIERLVQEFKQKQNILYISEFNAHISEVVLKEPVPFIYERLGERYKHFLIDEFQDTSIVQWQNLLPLIENALSEDRLSMVVGDGKQAIYRWRGGEVDQFADLPYVTNYFENEYTPQRELTLIRQHQVKSLNNNFRSAVTIVGFNNSLFRGLSEQLLNEKGKKIYADMEQQFKPGHVAGAVSIDFLPPALDKQEESEEEEKEEEMLSKVMEYVHFNLKKGFSYKEMAILVRSNTAGNKIATHLLENNVPVVSSESLLIAKSPEVNFILNLFQQLNNPLNLVAASAIVSYLCRMQILPADEEHSLLVKLNDRKEKLYLEEILKKYSIYFNRNYFLSLPVYDCCVELINLFQLQQQDHLYLQFFLDEVFNFSRTNTANSYSFLEWWENRKLKAPVILPAGTNAITIMTIHASKGLEFPVVIVPYCDWIIKSAEYLWVDTEGNMPEQLPVVLLKANKEVQQTKYQSLANEEKEKQVLDNLNLLYVALTRPEFHLHIISRTPKHHLENIYKWLKNYLVQQQLWSDDKAYYEWGSWIEQQQGEAHKREEGPYLKGLELRNWRSIVRIKEGNELTWAEEEQEDRREAGLLVHYVMSKIKNYDDVDKAVLSCLQEGRMNEEQAKEVKNRLNLLMNHPEIRPYFKPGLAVRNEAEILLPSGQSLRPDRFILQPEPVVIDYKTGKMMDVYREQLEGYANALKDLGYDRVKKLLIFINEVRIEEL